MIILRSTGPVISTRRLSRSAGMGATRHSASRICAGLGQEIRQFAGREARLARAAGLQQRDPPGIELAVQGGHEGQRLGGENFGKTRLERAAHDDTRGSGGGGGLVGGGHNLHQGSGSPIIATAVLAGACRIVFAGRNGYLCRLFFPSGPNE